MFARSLTFLAVLAALPACEEIEAPSGSTDTAETTDPVQRPPSNVPDEIAGRTWWWVSSYGAEGLTIGADGDYTSDVFVDGHPGESCGTEFFTHYVGWATFDGTTLTLTPETSERTKTDSCSDEVVSEETFDGDVRVYEWQLTSDSFCAEGIALTGDDGYAATYCADEG